MNRLRVVERKTEDGWEKIEFDQLKKDDVFRMFEDTGEPVVWRGETIYRATSDTYQAYHPEDQWNEAGYRETIDVMKESEHEASIREI